MPITNWVNTVVNTITAPLGGPTDTLGTNWINTIYPGQLTYVTMPTLQTDYAEHYYRLHKKFEEPKIEIEEEPTFGKWFKQIREEGKLAG